jgi:hypothetical protein
MHNALVSIGEAAARILADEVMILAGSEEALSRLPRGRWIGATTVYRATPDGAAPPEGPDARLFCTRFPEAEGARARHVPLADLPDLASGYRPGGFNLMMVPAFSLAHSEFVTGGPGYAGLFGQALGLWIAGVAPEYLDCAAPLVFDGAHAEAHDEGAVVLHCGLPAGSSFVPDMFNILAPGDLPAPEFRFAEGGLHVQEAEVDGASVNLARWIARHGIDMRRPLVARYSGELISIAIAGLDPEAGTVRFRVPVAPGVSYRLAQAPGTFFDAFPAPPGSLPRACIVNALYGDLRAPRGGALAPPARFGAPAYALPGLTPGRRGWFDLA